MCASICVDLFAKCFGFLEFLFLAVLLEKCGVAEPDVLDFACKFVFPLCHVHLAGFPNDALPVSRVVSEASGGKLRMMSSSFGPSFHFPRCGWSPRPAKRHEGSAGPVG